MGKTIELQKGQKFGKLTVIELVEKKLYINPNGKKLLKKYYKCQCECGNETIVYQGKLTSGQTKSCGCLTLKHGMYNTRLYNIWRGMIKRCYLITSKDYKRYGARGIKIYESWRKDFINFYNWAISNGYADNLSIDRIDSNESYIPSNCRWVNASKQANNRSSNQLITYNGETHNITEWAKKLNIKRHVIYQRLKANWSIEKALEKGLEC